MMRVPASLPFERAEGSAHEAVVETFLDRRATWIAVLH